jgi:D-sedoheptulose 7-phosphate isomerase
MVYARMIEAMCIEGDVLIALSTSGNSSNVIEAARKAKEKNMKVISFTGKTGGKLAELSDVLINIPSTDTPRIQECHMLIGHIICKEVEELIFPKK